MILAVALGGAIGAPLRLVIDRWITHRAAPGGERSAWPLGTLVVNVLGALALGLVAGAARHRGLSDAPTALLATGFCGALTTFSTVSVEVVRLTQAERWAAAGVVATANLAMSLAAAAAGLSLAAAGLA
ncbi:MAG: fluoride efflux transporter CrcB [Microthrixaceae bacterium]